MFEPLSSTSAKRGVPLFERMNASELPPRKRKSPVLEASSAKTTQATQQHFDPQSPHKVETNSYEKTFSSPFKPKPKPVETKKRKKAPTCLFGSSESEKISEKQSYPPLTPALEDQKKLIDHYLNKLNLTQEEKEITHRQVEQICYSTHSEPYKMAELGVLYFYLTKDGHSIKVLDEGSWLRTRQKELASEISQLINHFEIACDPVMTAYFPSGRIAYIKRAIAHMIFPNSGTFNRGGCETVKWLLNSLLGSQMPEEMQMQMLTIVDFLLSEPDFFEMFLVEHSTIHPRAAEMIRTDLFLEDEAPVGNLHACWAKLLMFFSLACQRDEGNCFAVSTVIHIFRKKPQVILHLLNQIIEKGSFTYKHQEFPIKPLHEGRKDYQKGFKITHQLINTVQLTAFSVVSVLCGAKKEAITREEGTLEELFDEQFPQASREAANERYLAFTRNSCLDAMVAVFQAVCINASRSPTASEGSTKDEFIKQVEKHTIDTYLRGKKTQSTKLFLESFRDEVNHRFWFVDYHNDSSEIKDGRFNLPHYPHGILIESDQEKAFRPFLNMRRLGYLKDGNFIFVDTLSKLSECFIEIAGDLAIYHPEEKWEHEAELFQLFLQDPSFVEQSAKVVAALNPQIPFSWHKYHLSDALTVVADGGFTYLTLDWLSLEYSIGYNLVHLTSRKNAKDLFVKVCASNRDFAAKNPFFLSGRNPTLQVGSSNHSFNLYPAQFSDYILNDTASLLDQTIYERAKNLRTKYPSMILRQRVLYDAFDQAFADQILKAIPKKLSSMLRFRVAVLEYLRNNSAWDKADQFDESFERVLYQVSFEDYKQKLPDLLSSLGLDNNQEVIEFIIKCIADYTRSDYFSISALACLTQSALFNLEFGFISIHRLEQALSDLLGIPRIIIIGNSNWMDGFKEDAENILVTFKFDLILNKYIFCKRENNQDIPDNIGMTALSLFYFNS